MSVYQYQNVHNGASNTSVECAVITCPLCRSLTPFSKHRPLRIEQDLWKRSKAFARADAVRPVKLTVTIPAELQSICLRIITPPSLQNRRGWLFPCSKQLQIYRQIEQAFPPSARSSVHISAQLAATYKKKKQAEVIVELELNEGLVATTYAASTIVKLDLSPRVLALIIRGPKALAQVVADQIEELFKAETTPDPEMDDWCSQLFCFWLRRSRQDQRARNRARERQEARTPGILTWQATYNL